MPPFFERKKALIRRL